MDILVSIILLTTHAHIILFCLIIAIFKATFISLTIYKEQLTASSIKQGNEERYGPQYANDGLLSRYSSGVYMSSTEDYPWIQWQLPGRIRITGVSIATRRDCCGYYFQNVEVRAGLDGINSTLQGLPITANEVCGKFEGPGNIYKEYKVNCNSTLLASFITVQIMNLSAQLQVNELKYTTEPHALIGNNILYWHTQIRYKI